jgi:hypothetical protein
METQDPDKLIQEQVKNLPKPVREAIASFDWAREVFDIGRKYSLHIDTIGEIQTEVMLVVLGLISPREFYDQMVEQLRMNEDLALEVADETNEKVFSRIRDYMKNYYEEENSVGRKITGFEKKILEETGIAIPGVSEEIKKEPLSVAPGAEIPPAKPAETEPTIPEPRVFKTKSSIANEADKPKNYLDPYREPVE